ncbi:Helix-turn-helix [Mesorhizobium albiziae]|uniref:Helix-turn-helix n=2 Tax=Neomesorhizobium albiziae TaxID=335020 RepID=A0A1I4EEG7_9HYPH|nr:hypothetical protein GCM10007937_52640 [Mesorhizobium albiziae]SFL03380.1 Helix-turn-helix [Mesorhizobium albiziae]
MQNVHYSVSSYSEHRRIHRWMKLRGVFGLNVQRLRRERKLSQEQLSFLAQRTRAYISSVEAGRRNATLDTLEILAKALEVEPYELITDPSGDAKRGQVGKSRAQDQSDQ